MGRRGLLMVVAALLVAAGAVGLQHLLAPARPIGEVLTSQAPYSPVQAPAQVPAQPGVAAALRDGLPVVDPTWL
ncbi:MAG: hypothetical protein LH468_11995, partial [Nocardioides sp.]|nr:hypothetical protein [Nocardioides sp.]